MIGMGTKWTALTLAALLIVISAATGCDKKTGGSSGQVAIAAGAVDGEWAVTVTHSVTTTCGEAPYDATWTMTLVQNGNTIYMSSDAGYSAIGTINGNQVTFTYSFPDGGGTTTSTVTLDFSSLTGGSLADIFSGSSTYIYSDSSFSCTGGDSWAGTRIPLPTGKGLTGAWDLTLTSLSTTCESNPQETVTIPVSVIQIGDEVTITILGLAEFEGVIASNDIDLSLNGEYSDSQFFVVTEGLLQIAPDGNTVSGPVDYSYEDLSDPLNDCSGVVEWSMVRITAIP